MSILFSLNDHRGGLAPLSENAGETAWDDQQGSVQQALQGASALTLDVYRDTPARIQCMRHDQTDDVTFWFQFTHRWNRGSVRPHIHFKPLANGAGNVRIDGYWAWTSGALALPGLSGWTAFRIDLPIVAADQYGERVASVGLIAVPAAAAVESAWLVLQFQRSGTDPADTYTTGKDHGTAAANLGLMGADVHYIAEKIGTSEPIPE